MKIGVFGLWGMNVPDVSFGGFETGFSEISVRLVEKGHEVTIFCRKNSYPLDKRLNSYRGVRLVYVPSVKSKNLGNIFSTSNALIHSFCQEDFDLYFFVNVGMGFHCLWAKLFGKKVILNVDGLDWKRAKWSLLGKVYFFLAAKTAVKFCNCLVSDSKGIQDFYNKEFNRDTVFIAYGANIETSQNSSLIEQYGVKPFQYYLIASRLVPENNPDLIISAFEKLNTDKKLLIAGGARYDDPFHQKIMSTKDERIMFTGHIDSAETIKELHCNCYAYIHGHSVGGTNPALLKALGYGNCILALSVPYNSEVLLDYGITFNRNRVDLLNKLQFIENNPDLASEYRRLSPQRIREAYTWEFIVDEYEKLFKQFVPQKSKD